MLCPYCSLPELESCMKVWEFMEMVHSRSYTHIIKNIYSDPSEVFDTILKDDRILERAKTVTESYDDFVNSAHVYDQNNFWELGNEGHDLGKIERKELKRKLYRQLQMSTSWKEYGFMFLLLAVLLLVNLNSWKVQQKLSPLLLEMRINTSPSPRTF